MGKYLERTARAAVYIHIDHIIHNLRAMKEILPGKTGLVAVLKANGYGHGASAIAHALENEPGVWGYALATAEEAIALRDAGIRKPLMILGYTWEYAYESLIDREIRMAVFRDDTLEKLSAAAGRVGKNALIHIPVDTGMSRIGVWPDRRGIEYVRRAWSLRGIEVEGLFTHFARADETDLTSAVGQLKAFTDFSEALRSEGMDIPLVHCDNSAGMLVLKHEPMNLARAGITMYGMWPSGEMEEMLSDTRSAAHGGTSAGSGRMGTGEDISLLPALEFKSHVVCVREIPANTPVSYGGTWMSARTSRIATIPVGYADGYPRSLSNKGEVLIRGVRVPIVGRVCMDQMMVDVTDHPEILQDDEVTLIGRDGREEITAEELGEKSGRFNYELVCDISDRVPRIVIRG